MDRKVIVVDRGLADAYLRLRRAENDYDEAKQRLDRHCAAYDIAKRIDRRTTAYKQERQYDREWREAADRYTTARSRLLGVLAAHMGQFSFEELSQIALGDLRFETRSCNAEV